jgi:SAM-dependent methyltransferase
MTQVALYVALAVVGAIAIWQLVVWMIETRDKNRKYRAACGSARAGGKPLLVVGGPWGRKSARHWFNKPAHGGGDVCLDIERRAIEGHPCAVLASVTHVPFRDGTFGAVFASHLLEHLPTVGDARQALKELHRVAGAVYVVCPSRQSIAAWVIPEHHLWVWQDGERTFLKQRGDSRGVEVYRC